MELELIALDVDGTLLNSENKIDSMTKEMIKKVKEAGIKVVICTGRPFFGIQEIMKELACENSGNTEEYAITFNGAMITEKDSGEILCSYPLSQNECLEIEKEINKLNIPYHFFDKKSLYTSCQPISPFTIHDVNLTGASLYFKQLADMKENQVIKIMMIDDKKRLEDAIEKLPVWLKNKYTAVRTLDFYYEFLSKKATKGRALKYLAKHLGISQDKVMAIGDNENDISMFKYAGISVAMGNASEQVKSSADRITLSNDKLGVAYILKEILEESNGKHVKAVTI